VIVFTTRSCGSTVDVQRYRMRWQIELVFKRLKSLAQLGHVPKHNDRSSRAWLYGKLLVVLLAQKLIRIGRAIFPPRATCSRRGGPCSPSREFSFALHQIQELSNRTSPCGKRSIRGIRLHMLWRKSRATDHFNWRNGVPREHCFDTDRIATAIRSRSQRRVVGPVLANNSRVARRLE
jgi:hypothetical protein